MLQISDRRNHPCSNFQFVPLHFPTMVVLSPIFFYFWMINFRQKKIFPQFFRLPQNYLRGNRSYCDATKTKEDRGIFLHLSFTR